MTKLSELYNPADKPDEFDFDALPAGPYTVKITLCEIRRTKDGRGEYLFVEMTVAEGQYEGRKVFERLNLKNANKTAERIAASQFAALRQAVGVLEPGEPADLMGVRFQVALKCEKRKDTGEMTNVVQRYIKRGQTVTTPQQADSPKGRTAANPDAGNDPYAETPF